MPGRERHGFNYYACVKHKRRHACVRDGCRFDTEKHSHARPADVHKYCGCSLATEPPTQSVRNTSEAPRGPSPFTRAGARLQNVPRTRVHGVLGRTKTRHSCAIGSWTLSLEHFACKLVGGKKCVAASTVGLVGELEYCVGSISFRHHIQKNWLLI